MFNKHKMSTRSGTDKQPKIKGLVKRCRSFKEDIMSRLARNRSIVKEDGSKVSSPSGWTSGGTSPIPSDLDITDPIVLITHRLKEAYLTLQFVESLIQKNCVDLLGGSSNVMLDLIGCLLNDVKKTSATDTSAYQSAVSQIKSALSDFLTAVDVLLLKERCDEVQRELYFEKVLDTLKTTRNALSRLKSVVDGKDSNHLHQTHSVRHHSTGGHSHHHHGPLLTSTPTKNLQSPTSKSDINSPFNPLSPVGEPLPHQDEQKSRPPLPPKLKQWTAKSFDSEWPTPSSSSSGPATDFTQYQNNNNVATHNLSPQHQSLLSQWLEQANPHNGTASSASSATSSSHHHHHHHQRSLSQHHRHQRTQIHSTSCASSRFDDSSGGGPGWTESQIYVARSSHSGASASSSSLSQPQQQQKHHQLNNSNLLNLDRKQRTYSDSYQLEVDSQESLDRLDYENCDSRSGRSGATHNSQSLSLGSSLDNLLLVDSQSQQSGLSPNSNTSTGGGYANSGTNNRISVSSNLSGGGASISGKGTHGLASLSNFDPDADLDNGDPDADNVFVSTEAISQQGNNSVQKRCSPLLTKTEAEDDEIAPSLPQKQNRRQFLLGNGNGGNSNYFASGYNNGGGGCDDPRCPSPYENVDETDLATWHGRVDNFQTQQHKQFMSYSESRNTLVGAAGYDNDDRPPLPPKKKHSLIAAYVEFLHNFESFSQQHHTHFHNHLNQIHHQHHRQSEQFADGDCESQRRQFRSERSATLHNPGGLSLLGGVARAAYSSTSYHQFSFSSSLFSPTEEVSPTHQQQMLVEDPLISPSTSSHNGSPGHHYPPALPPKKTKQFLNTSSVSDNGSCGGGGNTSPLRSVGQSPVHSVEDTTSSSPQRQIPTVVTPVHTSANNSMESPQLSIDDQAVDLYLMDSSSMLVLNDSLNSTNANNSSNKNSDGPEIKGGDPHLLIVYAASPDLKDVRFREVFLLTYRTFVRPTDVVNLLWKRYQYFEKKTDRPSLVHSRATLDLFVDVVNSLTPMDLEDEMVSKLRTCIYHLVSCGEIQSALKARKGLIVKYQIRVKLLSPRPTPASLAVTAEAQTLLQWNATSIAQQMTLLDAELFRQLEPAELLLWAREQTEDFCPALNHFTEHFNKVSYWARSKVLLCCNSRERNRTMKKMIEVMRKLREYNNFNSLLAVLAALDSAPIRRLGFSRRLTEALKPHAALTDSSGSFRTYRQALAESKPPCIPYIGLVLQDLTFVHIGNADFLADGKVNWVKRWQQWIVLEPVRRFHTCNYGFVRNDPLLNFLNNFDESLNDDELWQLSESIKPRAKS